MGFRESNSHLLQDRTCAVFPPPSRWATCLVPTSFQAGHVPCSHLLPGGTRAVFPRPHALLQEDLLPGRPHQTHQKQTQALSVQELLVLGKETEWVLCPLRELLPGMLCPWTDGPLPMQATSCGQCPGCCVATPEAQWPGGLGRIPTCGLAEYPPPCATGLGGSPAPHGEVLFLPLPSRVTCPPRVVTGRCSMQK